MGKLTRAAAWLAMLSVVGCVQGKKTRPSVVPTPAVIDTDNPAIKRIGVRALYVTWAGAKGATGDVTRTKQQARDRADMVAQIARMDGERFPSLVREYSDRAPLADPGGAGALLERESKILEPEAVKAAFAIAQSSASLPIETATGYIIVYRTKPPQGGPIQIQARHILLSYVDARGATEKVTRSKEEAKRLAERLVTETRSQGTDWVALWEKHSDEPGGREGGNLGSFGRGHMVPSFERAAFRLAVGEISDAVESPFGYHVIQRLR